MSILGCISLRCRYYSRLSSAVSYRYPVPKDLLSGSAPRPDWTSNADRRPMQLCWTVNRLIFLRDLDTAAEYARLAYSHFYCNSTVTTCESIIKAMCEVKRYRDALDLFHHFYNELKLCSIYNSPNYIVKALCELGRLEDALVLFRAMPCQGSITYCHLTKALVYAGRLDEALCLVRKHPMPLSCSNLIRGFLNLGNLCMANQLLDEFESNGFWHIDEKSQPGLLRVALIEHSLKQGNDEEAMRGYRYLVCNDRFIYGDTGNALLQLLLRCGKKTEAWELFHRMIDGVGQVGSETIDIMVGECFEEGRFREGIETFYKVRAKEEGSSLKAIDYRNVITRCCEQGMLAEAECLFAELRSERFLTVDVSTYRAMMDAYVKAGRVDDALRTANTMVHTNLKGLSLYMQC